MASVRVALLPRPISLTPATAYVCAGGTLGARLRLAAAAAEAAPAVMPNHSLIASVRALLLPRPTWLMAPTEYGTPGASVHKLPGGRGAPGKTAPALTNSTSAGVARRW